VNHILASQDADGYIGIFSPRNFATTVMANSGHKPVSFAACLLTPKQPKTKKVYEAVKRAVDRTIEGYSGKKSIFNFTQHDALYTDMSLNRFMQETGDKKYLEVCGLRIYRERATHLAQFHPAPFSWQRVPTLL
jgi:hypothetical protein